jgi:6-phospho-3-hexuloisomerase
MNLTEIAAKASTEVAEALSLALPDQADAMATLILNASKIALHGLGREGLMMKALAMRLFHMGLDVHVVGEMTMPYIGKDDLLIVSAGPGHFETVLALVNQAKKAGAQTLCITADPLAAVPTAADHVIHLAAQTMANDQDGPASILPMGSLYEVVMFMFFEILVLNIRDMRGINPEDMRAFHTNIE